MPAEGGLQGLTQALFRHDTIDKAWLNRCSVPLPGDHARLLPGWARTPPGDGLTRLWQSIGRDFPLEGEEARPQRTSLTARRDGAGQALDRISHYGPVELALAAEVVGDRSRIDSCEVADAADRCAAVAVLGEELGGALEHLISPFFSLHPECSLAVDFDYREES